MYPCLKGMSQLTAQRAAERDSGLPELPANEARPAPARSQAIHSRPDSWQASTPPKLHLSKIPPKSGHPASMYDCKRAAERASSGNLGSIKAREEITHLLKIYFLPRDHRDTINNKKYHSHRRCGQGFFYLGQRHIRT